MDDVHLPNMAHVAFLRSPYAHARIKDIDTSGAEDLAGVVAVHTAESLGDYWKQGPFLVSPPPIERLTFHERTQPILAKGKARHVGEPIVAVVAIIVEFLAVFIVRLALPTKRSAFFLLAVFAAIAAIALLIVGITF